MKESLSQKSLDVLELCKLPINSDQRERVWSMICEKYSEKSVVRKLEELERRGYIETGTSPKYSWILGEGGRTS